MRKILLTGFDPFNKEKINPSWEAIKDIRAENIKVLQLATSFKRAKETLIEVINQYQPDIVLMIGQAGGRSMISLEKVAINLKDGQIADNDGYKPSNEKIRQDGADGYFSTLDLDALLVELKDKLIPCHISYTAGTYVCNSVLYEALYYAKKKSIDYQAGFVHIPYLPSQVLDKARTTPSMDLNMIKSAIKIILDFLSKTND